MPKDHNFATPGYGVPSELRPWFESFILQDATLRSPEQQRIARLLQDRNVIKAMKRPLSRVRKEVGWPEQFEEFFAAVARLPDLVPQDISLTPNTAATLLEEAQSLAVQLASKLREHPSLFIYARRSELIAELHQLAGDIHNRLKSALDPNVGPAVGNCFGNMAVRNWIARNVSTLSEFHLGEPFPTFVAAIASVLTESTITESSIRDLALPLR